MSTISERLLSALGGSYTIEGELTGGGMALVFVGQDHDLDRKVVIKILPPELAASVSAERFRREIMTVARLQHPHIVPILKAGEVDGLPYFVMPYVDGESIDVKLRRTGTFGVRETLAIMVNQQSQLATVVRYRNLPFVCGECAGKLLQLACSLLEPLGERI